MGWWGDWGGWGGFSKGETLTSHAERHVHLQLLVVDLVLDRLLARLERLADLLHLRVVDRRRQLLVQLGLEGPVGAKECGEYRE